MHCSQHVTLYAAEIWCQHDAQFPEEASGSKVVTDFFHGRQNVILLRGFNNRNHVLHWIRKYIINGGNGGVFSLKKPIYGHDEKGDYVILRKAKPASLEEATEQFNEAFSLEADCDPKAAILKCDEALDIAPIENAELLCNLRYLKASCIKKAHSTDVVQLTEALRLLDSNLRHVSNDQLELQNLLVLALTIHEAIIQNTEATAADTANSFSIIRNYSGHLNEENGQRLSHVLPLAG